MQFQRICYQIECRKDRQTYGGIERTGKQKSDFCFMLNGEGNADVPTTPP
jgi:hypothetical protein